VHVLTAKCLAFDREQMIRTKQSVLDLKAWFDTHPRVAGIAVRSVWRLTYGLEELIGVDNELNDTTGQDLAAVLETVDAVITTPSTAMLEGMLQGLPVALLDYHNRPHYVPAAWQITAVQQIDQILSELLAPDTAKMLYQRSILHDALECQSPATSRLVQLVAAMQRIAHDCVSRGAALEFPAQILDGASNEPCLPDGLFDPVHLFPRQPQFAQNDTRALQAAAAHYQELASSWEQQCQQHLSQLQELHMAAEQQLEKNSQNWQLVLEENSANWQRVVDENSANWQRVLDENSANWQRELAARPILNASRSYPA